MDSQITSTTNSSKKMDLRGLRVGLLYWGNYNSVINIQRLFEHLGFEVNSFLHSEKLPDRLDLVFVRGPYGSLVPLTNQLIARPADKRPAFVYLMVEPFPHPYLPEFLRNLLGRSRSRVERFNYRQRATGDWELRSRSLMNLIRAYRFNYYGDLLWMRSQGILSVLAVPSKLNGEFLRMRGFDPLVLPLCYPRDPQVNFRQERDIPVLWIGKAGSERRKRILKRVREDLKKRGVELLMIDGVENPYIFGKKRDNLLSRTKIVLNVLRQWWDDNSMRYLLSMPLGALIVTEPTLAHTSFRHGQHLVEAPVEQIADKICFYLSHEEQRLQIVERAYDEITRYSPVDVMHQVIEKAMTVYQQTHPAEPAPINSLPQHVKLPES